MTKSKANRRGSGAARSDERPVDDQDDEIDGCVENIELNEAEATLDVELPPARGGVERAV